MAVPIPEEDALASLEERIRRTLELVSAVRAERDAALAERDEALDGAGSNQSELRRLKEQVAELLNERRQVRARIQKLLGQIDLVSGGG